jgi:hypothetical protein
VTDNGAELGHVLDTDSKRDGHDGGQAFRYGGDGQRQGGQQHVDEKVVKLAQKSRQGAGTLGWP